MDGDEDMPAIGSSPNKKRKTSLHVDTGETDTHSTSTTAFLNTNSLITENGILSLNNAILSLDNGELLGLNALSGSELVLTPSDLPMQTNLFASTFQQQPQQQQQQQQQQPQHQQQQQHLPSSTSVSPNHNGITDSFIPNTPPPDIDANPEVQNYNQLPLPSPTASPVHDSSSPSTDLNFEKHKDIISRLSLSDASSGSRVDDIESSFQELCPRQKNYIIFKLLRRLDRKILSAISNEIQPALRHDILLKVPLEVSIKILSYLCYKDLGNAAQVSKYWKTLVDSENVWKALLKVDEYETTEEDVDQAMKRGWSLDGDDIEPVDFGLNSSVEHVESKDNKGSVYKAIYKRRHILQQRWMDPNSKPRRISVPSHGRHVVTCLQFDSDKIVTGSDDLNIHVYSTKTGELRSVLKGHDGGVWALQYTDNILVSGSTDRTIRIWDIKRKKTTQILYGHSSTVRCLEIIKPVADGVNSDGSIIYRPPYPLLVTGSRDHTLRLWKLPQEGDSEFLPETTDAANPYFLRTLQGHLDSVRTVAAYGNTIVSGSYDTFVKVWEADTGECRFTLKGHEQRVYNVVIDKERNRCISGSLDFSVKIWCLKTGACLYTLEGHTSLVGLLDLNNTALVSAAADKTVRIWEPETGKFLKLLKGHTQAITCFQHDQFKLVSGSQGMLKLWDIKTGKFVKDLLHGVDGGVWQVRFDRRRCVAAVKRGENTSSIEILDFGYNDGPEEIKEDDEEDENMQMHMGLGLGIGMTDTA